MFIVNAFTVRIASLEQLEHRRFSSTQRPHPHPGVDAITSPIPITSHIRLTFLCGGEQQTVTILSTTSQRLHTIRHADIITLNCAGVCSCAVFRKISCRLVT